MTRVVDLAKKWCQENVPEGIPHHLRKYQQSSVSPNEQLTNIHNLNDRLKGFFMNCYITAYEQGVRDGMAGKAKEKNKVLEKETETEKGTREEQEVCTQEPERCCTKAIC